MLFIDKAEGCGPTGTLLGQLLTERGIDQGPRALATAVVCWGNGYEGNLPSLNRNATRFNKLEQLRVLATPESHNLKTVPFMAPLSGMPANSFPCFARKLSHAGGTDIRLCLEPEHASLYAQAGWNFATKYIPNSTEYRIWIYRKQHLGTYQKSLARPQEFMRSGRFGANYDNGYSFQIVAQENLPTAAIEMAKSAVDALGLDFGAVDILKGRDNHFYILEVNTAPGVESSARQAIQLLADKIAYWVGHNYLRRTGDESAYQRPAAQGAGTRAVTRPVQPPTPLAEVIASRPSFLPRRGESYTDWSVRVNA